MTPSTLRLAEQLGLFQDAPGLEVVRQVNDKRYSHSLEQELGIALPHSGLVDSLERLEEAVRDCPHDWVLKHPMGFSARERAVGKCGTISPSAAGWAGKKLRQGWSLIFEPWIYERRDFSVHFEIGADGRPTFLGWCELVGDLGGAYRGNRVSPAASLPEGVGASVRQAVERVAALGYRGLVGVDGFAGSWEGHSLLRPLVEINARCSFGRLALALADWLPAGWSYLWWHPRTADSLPSYPSLPPGGTKEPGLYALPALVDPEGRSRTVVAVAPSLPELEQLELLLRPGLAGR